MIKVLVIDDEKPTLYMFRMFLNAYGYNAFTAESGEEGIEVFERERPPLVVTDVKMPGMDGIEVLEYIKKADPATEVIVITGHGDMDLAIKALNMKAADFINKPISREALRNALQRAEERMRVAKGDAEQITLELLENAAVINVRGNVTSQTETLLGKAYDEAESHGKDKTIMNFDSSSSINGAGIAILTRLLIKSRDNERKVFLTGLSDNFKKVFEIVGITKLVKVCDTNEEALAG